MTDPAAGGSAFVEIYVPRDSTPVNFTGMTLYVDGQKRHTFGARTVQPGFGVIVAETAMSGNGTPVEISNDPFWPSSLTDHQPSSFEIRSGAALTDPVPPTSPCSPRESGRPPKGRSLFKTPRSSRIDPSDDGDQGRSR